MNQRFAIGAPKWGPNCYAANREGYAKLSARSGSTPIWDRLNHKKVLPMCLGESVTYVLEHSPLERSRAIQKSLTQSIAGIIRSLFPPLFVSLSATEWGRGPG